jgi:hypothetical protein
MTSLGELPENDEFHGVNFSQAETLVDEKTGASTSKVREVKVGTYSLMSWWKGLLGNTDTIDISDDSDRATLSYPMTIDGEGSSTDAMVYLEVFEDFYPDCPIVIFYCYPDVFSDLDSEVMQNIATFVGLVNQNNMSIGNLEPIWSEDGSGRVRYRSALCLQAIAVGKAEAIGNFVAVSHKQLTLGVNKLIEIVTAES